MGTLDYSHASSDLTDIIPILFSFLNNPTSEDDPIFIAGSEALQEIMQHSVFSDGSGSKALTEPLLFWLQSTGARLIDGSVAASNPGSGVSHSICKLLAALGDHSSLYIANNLASQLTVQPPRSDLQQPIPPSPYTKGQLVQTLLQYILVYTGLPGYYGLDEEESENTLQFWFTLQESLWSTDYYIPEDDNEEKERRAINDTAEEPEELKVAKAVYTELVKILRRKVAFPAGNSGWAKGALYFLYGPFCLLKDNLDQIQTFEVYVHGASNVSS